MKPFSPGTSDHLEGGLQVLNFLFTVCTIQLLQLTWQLDYLLAAAPLLKRRMEVVAHHLGLRLR